MRIRRQKGAIVVAQTGFEAFAIDKMKRAGHRVTVPRVRVVRTLSQAQRPMTAYGIHQEIVASGGKVDVVSVYRILQALSDLGLVHHIGIVDGYMACRLEDSHEEECEHVVCTECGRVTELSMPSSILDTAQEQLSLLGFAMKQTRVEILAVCPDCAV